MSPPGNRVDFHRAHEKKGEASLTSRPKPVRTDRDRLQSSVDTIR